MIPLGIHLRAIASIVSPVFVLRVRSIFIYETEALYA
jgi:hypothetical protein